MKKRIVAIILSVVLCLGVFTGCDEEIQQEMNKIMDELMEEYKNQAKDMIENLSFVVVIANTGKMGRNGQFPLYLNLHVRGEAENPTVKIKGDDCILFVNKSNGWSYSGNSATKSGTLSEGNHNVEMTGYCRKGKICSKETHSFSLTITGTNVVDFESNSVTVGRGASDSESFIELEKAMDEYIEALAGLNAEGLESPGKVKKDAAMVKVRKCIDINLDKMITSPPKNKAERAAMKECMYMAIFDAYLANNMKEESSWWSTQYYENISPSDFSDGCISAAMKMTEGTKNFVENVLESYEYSGKYKYDGYEYDITVNVPFKSVSYFSIELVAKNNARYTYNDTTDVNNLGRAQAATLLYMNELVDLYEDANIAAIEETIGAVKKTLEPCETKAPGYSQKKEIKGKLGKIDKKVAKTLEQYGLAGIDEFFGCCWAVYDVGYSYASFAEMCKNESDVIKVAREAKKQKDNMEELFGRIQYGTTQNASTRLLIAAQEKLLKCINNVYDDCVTELGEEPEPKAFWQFWKK